MDENNLETEEEIKEDNTKVSDKKEEQQPDSDKKSQPLEENTNDFDKSDEVKNQKEIVESDVDKTLHKEVLEKLDIVKKEQNENKVQDLEKESYLKKIKDLQEFQTKTKIEKSISQDFDQIQKLVKASLINSAQGQNLKKQVLKKAFDKLVQAEKSKRNFTTDIEKGNLQNQVTDKNKVFEDFSKSNPDFFIAEGRKEVLDYLKSGDVVLDGNELGKITDIIRRIEKSAIDRYLQKVAHEKTLKTSNENAKQRLTANAQKSNPNAKYSGTFTREQIGKMSPAEFSKYEKAIMEQLKKGIIR